MHALSNTTRMLVAMAAMAAMTGVATTATAQTTASTQARYDDVVVTYSDLNLNSPAGLKVLYARLTDAAERACGSAHAPRDLNGKMEYRACVDSTLNRSIDKVGVRQLQALHVAAHVRNAG
jgi:UrcA family protein